MAFDINAARQAGYSTQEITDFMSKQNPNFDVQGALKAGYSLDDVASRLQKPAPTPPVVKAPPSMLDIAKNQLSKPILQQMGELKDAAASFGKHGEDVIATGLAQSGMHPVLAAIAGRAFNTLTNIPGAVAEGMSMAGPGEEAKAAGEAVAGSGVMDAIRYTGQKQAEALGEKIANVPVKMAAKQELLSGMKAEAGTAIGDAEKSLGVDAMKRSVAQTQNVIGTPAKAVAFADRAAQLASKGTEALSSASPDTLQFYRKTAQAALNAHANLPPETVVKLAAVNKAFTEALSTQTDGALGEAVSRYADIEKAMQALPASATKEKQILRAALVKAKNVAMDQARTRKVIGGTVVAGALAGGGSYAARKLLGQ